MKKQFDAVKFMRQRRAEMEKDWEQTPRSEQIRHLRKKYPEAVKTRTKAA